MLFIVQVGICLPSAGPFGDAMQFTLGIVDARSKAEAARELGLIQWDGWKNIPGVNKKQWRSWGKNLYFTPFDTKRIDRTPKDYQGVNCQMHFITIRKITELKGKIPNKIWEQF